ncbi:MAG: Gar1/Naf1 family protein [Natronomonas sp.]
MRPVGEVLRVAGGVAVVRNDDPPDIGTEVISSDLDVVGRVVDIFGPVERPYVAVATSDGVAPASLLGQRLYARSD